MDSLCLKTGIHAAIPVGGGAGPALDARACCSSSLSSHQQVTAVATPPNKATSSFRFSFKYPRLQSLWPPRLGGCNGSGRYNGMALDHAVLVDNAPLSSHVVDEAEETLVGPSPEGHNGNWVLKVLDVWSLRKEQGQEHELGITCDLDTKNGPEKENGDVTINLLNEEEEEEIECEIECEGCNVDDGDDDDVKRNELDREWFSKILKRVSLGEAELYAQMSYLANLAYCIPRMTAGNLLKRQGLHFVTSSIDKRELAKKSEKNQVPSKNQEPEINNQREEIEAKQRKNNGHRISASTAYQVAASAASYLHFHTKSILPFKSSKGDSNAKSSPEGVDESNVIVDIMNPEMASLMATTDSVTAVVAVKEEVKQAFANDLSSTRSSPCEWFICDDDKGTRYFVIQGSETLASWQANLFFGPAQFEGLDVLVHRGIYEAAKGMYEQMLPEVRAHLKSHGSHATFRFTGHSLGGSLSLLLNLMLLIRGEAPTSSLLPIITFGAPSVMCGGDQLLRKLGLPRSHVQAITMHRDIVPRAFSCNYPNHFVKLLKVVNGSFRKHPCLNNQKLLYAPMGELLILQPDEKFSPHHHLLPEGCGLYFLSCPLSDASESENQLRAAQTAFLNSPHPLEILSDRAAYGSAGAIQRDHDMKSYLKSVQNVIRHELNQIRKSRRACRRKFWWSLLAAHRTSGSGIIVGRPVATINHVQNQFNFSGVLRTGRESLKRFSRLVASQHMDLLVVLLFPARLLLLGAYSLISFR